ncbi:MAG: LysR family transcriptional regulator [Henriciella sp.]|uniref:LysR family transcriptional regulator n=1 Tax=Henriciella sp. TaxID=1968823 RepID=UPI003C707172
MTTIRFDWDKLRVFCAVAELGSMSAAAARVGESTPTVSRKIDDLEQSLNAQLFKRSTRGVELTEAGKKTYQYALAMSDAATAISNEISDTDNVPEGPVTLQCGDGLGAHWIGPRLPAFHLAHPKIQLTIKVTDELANLVDGEADIAIQYTRPRQNGLIAARLGVIHYMFYSSAAYLKTYGEPASLFDLAQHRVILNTNYKHQIERWMQKSDQFRKVLDVALLTNSGAVMREVCANGGGIAVFPSYAHLVDERLVPLALPEVAPIQFWLTYTERLRRLSEGRIVIDWLKSAFDPLESPWMREQFIHPNDIDPDKTERARANLFNVPLSD